MSLKEKKILINIRTLLVLLLFIGCQKNASKELHTGPMNLPDNIDFNYHVRPILSDRCYKCHGPDEKVRQANLRFDTKEGAFSLLDSAEKKYAIVPSEPDKSLIVHRIQILTTRCLHLDPNCLYQIKKSKLLNVGLNREQNGKNIGLLFRLKKQNYQISSKRIGPVMKSIILF